MCLNTVEYNDFLEPPPPKKIYIYTCIIVKLSFTGVFYVKSFPRIYFSISNKFLPIHVPLQIFVFKTFAKTWKM